ncbi:hypothetical protein OIU78_014867 [Salix suchowensis]|nr:hypothetical protein OIU78_014867 [Salix suchowensis]
MVMLFVDSFLISVAIFFWWLIQFSLYYLVCCCLQITQLLESHGFLDYLERGIDYDGNNNNLDKLQDTIGRGQNPISILPTAVAETEITTISDPYVGILGFPQTSGQKNKKRRGNKFLQQQEELVDTLSMLLGIRVFAKSMGFLRHFNLIFIVLA